jgi:LmbE family N-acetylglucosaminyl deacetylase
MSFNPKRVLIVAAHPDDEVLGCGGTIAKHANNGDRVYVAALADGVSSRKGYKLSKKQIRKKEFIKAAKMMGVSKTFYFGYKDQRLDTISLLKITQRIEKIINKIKPDIIYTHHKNDLNMDHRIAFDAVLTACRPKIGQSVREILSFEIPSSTEWNYPHMFTPNVFIEISATINKKIMALESYQSEVDGCKYPCPTSPKAVRILAQKRGCEAGMEFTEAFELVRSLK